MFDKILVISITATVFLAGTLKVLADDSDEPKLQQIESSRAEIQASMAENPENPTLQKAGENALQALDAWERELHAAQSETTDNHLELAGGTSVPPATGQPGPFPNVLRGLDSWNINENYVGVAIADANWTIDEYFPGTKLLFTARYSFRRRPGEAPESDCDCIVRPTPYEMFGTLGVHLQSGQGESGIEYGYGEWTTWSWQRNFLPESGRFRPFRDTLELGGAKVGKDDPLGIDSYAEITVARVGRTWSLIRQNSDVVLLVGLGGSVGYAWADSLEPLYDDVSNPFMGAWITLAAVHQRWGKIYAEQRNINGFSFSSPSAGGSTSREARFRAGFITSLWSCINAELFVDKRSFNFSDHRLADLYTKSRRVGVEVGCTW